MRSISSLESTVGVQPYFQSAPMTTMGDQAIITDNVNVIPGVSYNLPPIRRLTGQKRDRDVYGILE